MCHSRESVSEIGYLVEVVVLHKRAREEAK